MPKMSVSDLKAMLDSEKADALAAISADRLMEERADAMDYYLGDMRKHMPAQEGRSRAVSTDVADTIEGLMPNLMDIFAGSDEVVRFEPVGPEDEAAAAQETDYVNHVFMQQNPGFMVLDSFIKDALLSKVGIVKVWWDEREEEYDAGKYRLMMKAKTAVSARPVPPVQRPGMARPATERDNADMRTLSARLSSSGDIKDAVALYHARKSNRR